MPDGHDPRESPLDPIKEPRWRYDHFPVWELGEFRDHAARFRELCQAAERRFNSSPKAESTRRIVLAEL